MKAVLLLLFSLSSIAYGQAAKCTIPLDKSPVIRGLKLGMSKQDVAKAFPRARTGDFIAIGESDMPDLPEFSNLRDIVIDFFDGRIMNVSIFYRRIPFESAGAFAENVSTNFDLPLAAWMQSNSKAHLICPEFMISLDLEGRLLMLTDIAAAAAQQNRNNKAFKP